MLVVDKIICKIQKSTTSQCRCRTTRTCRSLQTFIYQLCR